MEDKPKENKCEISFTCGSCLASPCLHFTEAGGIKGCRYENDTFECTSNVAQINKMVITLKKAGFKLVKV